MTKNKLDKIATIILVVLIGSFIVLISIFSAPTQANAADEKSRMSAEEAQNIIDGIVAKMQEAMKVYGTLMSNKATPTPAPTPEMSNEDIVRAHLGDSVITVSTGTLTKMSLPSAYYNIDFSSYQPWMPASAITSKGSDSWRFLHGSGIYVGDDGIYRHQIDSATEFNVNNNSDDFVVALGTFYKTRHTCGERFLVVTDCGWYTISCGDEESDRDTDSHHMFIPDPDGIHARMIEYIVDRNRLDPNIRKMGNVVAGPHSYIKGEIRYIYKITK